MSVNLSMFAGVGQQFFDNNGNPLSGGKLYSYAAGTNTPQATFTTAAGDIAHTNPIILDAAGRVPGGGEIWLSDLISYKFVVTTSTDITIGTYDNVTGNGSGIAVGIYAALAAPTGASVIGFQLNNSADVETVADKLRQTINVQDFGAVCDGVTDDSAAVQAAVDYCLTFDPPAILTVSGLCRLDSSVNINRGVDAVTSSTFFIIKGDGIAGGFYAYNGVNLFSTTLPSFDPGGQVASQKIHFDNIVFKSEFPSNPAYVLDGGKFLRMKFTDCSFHRIKLLTSTAYLQTYYFNNCMCYGWLDTFFAGTDGAYDIKFDNFIAEAGTAFYSVTCTSTGNPNAQISFTNSLFQSISGAPINADKAQGFAVENCYFEGNGSNGAPDLKFDTTNNLANLTPNGAIIVTGCYFSQRLANFNDPNYWSIRWGRVRNGFATANYLVDLGTGASLKLSNTIPESRVVFLGEDGYAQGYFSETIFTPGTIFAGDGYVMPGTGGEALKIIRGSVADNGDILRGTGFTVTKGATGLYQIDVQTAFASTPSSVVTPADTNAAAVSAFTSNANASTTTVSFRDAADAYINTAFNFIIVGPA